MKKYSNYILYVYFLYTSYSLPIPVVYTTHNGKGFSIHRPVSKTGDYISGNNFRAHANFIVGLPFNTEDVKDGDIVFMKSTFLEFFFSRVHPYIDAHYILITHDGDAPAPGKFLRFLNDKKLIAWFGQNCDITHHRKFFPIPIGLMNRTDLIVLDKARKQAPVERDILLYLNFSKTHPERKIVREIFEKQPFCVCAPRKKFAEYLQDLARTKFVLSPQGVGVDCFRAWESLLMGAIPVMKHSHIDPIFEGLPVVLVHDWAEVTEEFLHKKYEEITAQTWDTQRMFFPYWWSKIDQVQKAAKKRYEQA